MKLHLNKLSLQSLLCVSLMLALAMSPQSAFAAPLCVDPGGAGGCFTTIQAAINAAGPGDTITVAAGTYAETLSLVDKDNISITGAGVGLTTINAQASLGYGWDLRADGVTLSNFTFVGPSAGTYGIKVSGNSPTPATGFTIHDVAIQNSKKSGLDINGVNGVTVTDVSVTNTVSGAGIALTDVNNATLTNITTSGNAWGSIAIMTYGYWFPGGSDTITLANITSTEAVYTEVGNYTDPLNPYPITNLTASEFVYRAINRTDAANHVFFTETRDLATAIALGFPTPAKSFVLNTTNGHYIVVPGLSIQTAIDEAANGSTIEVSAGTYDQTINIATRNDLVLLGADAATTIIQPSTTIAWNAGGYGTSRQTVLRVVNSTGITVQGLTFDLDLVKGNYKSAALLWDATGSLLGNTFKNNSVPDASGGYYEIGVAIRTESSSYTAGSRAPVTISGNTFTDMGRVSLLVHDFVVMTIANNTFSKTLNDFGYAIELGSESTGSITGNTIYGFDTPAASDGSNSAGIYVENAFTGTAFPGTVVSPITKNVTIHNNEVYDSQWALYLGNEFDTYAGNVDITATVTDNNFHNNVDGAIYVTDEDKADGSSVTANFTNNTLTNNGGFGYQLSTGGDGELNVNIQGGSITGHNIGVHLQDLATGTSASTYNVTIENAQITGNTTYGVQNEVTGVTVDASPNWWGSTDPVWGSTVSGDVTYTPWCGNAACTFLIPVPATWRIAGVGSYTFGNSNDIPVMADYTGDGQADIAVFRPSTGTWNLRGVGSYIFGTAGDIPVPADYNGDGKADIAVFRPSTSTWYIRGVGSYIFGTADGLPVPADYNGDGKADIAVFRPSTSTWYIRGVGSYTFGALNDIPVVADYSGDGKADIAVFRPSTSTWYIRGVGSYIFGTAGDIPVPADYTGDGKADIAVFHPSTGTWHIRGFGIVTFGALDDIPVVADYTGDGQADIAVFDR